MDAATAITVQGLRKSYGEVEAVRGVVFHHLTVSPEVQARLNPPIIWNGWVVPTWLQLGLWPRSARSC